MANTNEKRLIDANALMAEVNRTAEITKRRREQFSLRNLIMCIKNAPTVDAVEVVHGWWTTVEDDWTLDTIYKCSVCKEEFVTIDGTPAENLWNYCPNCGAKMDLED